MTVTQFFRHRQPPTEKPPASQSQSVHDAAQNLASELRRFRRDWPHFSQLAQFELVVSDDLLSTLNRLCTDLRQFHFAVATPIEADREWLGKLSKMQEGIPRVEAAAQLLRAKFLSAEQLKGSCEKLLAASKWTVEFQLCLRSSIDALQNFREANGLRSRIDMLERELARAHQMDAAVMVEDRSASLEAESAEARQVLGFLAQEPRQAA